jgi:hypothetical protein
LGNLLGVLACHHDQEGDAGGEQEREYQRTDGKHMSATLWI